MPPHDIKLDIEKDFLMYLIIAIHSTGSSITRELAGHGGEEARDLVRVRDVDLQRVEGDTRRGRERGDRLLAVREDIAGHGHRGSLPGQLLAHRSANTRAPS